MLECSRRIPYTLPLIPIPIQSSWIMNMLRFFTLFMVISALAGCAQAPSTPADANQNDFKYKDIQNARLQIRVTSTRPELQINTETAAYDIAKGIKKRWPEVTLLYPEDLTEPDAILVVVINEYSVDYKTRPDVIYVPDPELAARRAEYTLHETITRLETNATLIAFHSGTRLWAGDLTVADVDDNRLETGCFSESCRHTGIQKTVTFDLIKTPNQASPNPQFVTAKTFEQMLIALGSDVGDQWPDANCREDGLGNCFVDSWRKAFAQ
ncbi:Uncharacterised protein [BD1-7 clade bacterium]|uniref:Uncharacterized protein n=1 Tax=BD1-7 clade bacterium TaxID=2029982 RepID=A0A5S9P5G3_9GAMM|nr:Uncharacterised protein [BD1-7 clade bacterium]CAA0098421.1 Uncharacterised protein [BD1-7 clade bacterium]